jgi:hypothetical protein
VVKKKSGEMVASKIWSPELAHEVITNADIYIDEAYTDYSSREYKKFSIDLHTFFATNGHNDININLLAQNPARIDLIIREMCSSFLYVKKVAVPGPLWLLYAKIKNLFGADLDPTRPRPLFFKIYTYLDEKSMSMMNPDSAYQVTTVWFNSLVAGAYDTHYYRNAGKPYEGVSWLSRLKVSEKLVPCPEKTFWRRFREQTPIALQKLKKGDFKGFWNMDV